MTKPMSDKTTNLETLKNFIREFSDERDWGKYHSPKNLSMALAAETGELMEFFMWLEGKESIEELEKKRVDVEHEIADIVAFLLLFCSRYNIDISKAFERKMEINALKYPIDKAKGSWHKYTDL